MSCALCEQADGLVALAVEIADDAARCEVVLNATRVVANDGVWFDTSHPIAAADLERALRYLRLRQLVVACAVQPAWVRLRARSISQCIAPRSAGPVSDAAAAG